MNGVCVAGDRLFGTLGASGCKSGPSWRQKAIWSSPTPSLLSSIMSNCVPAGLRPSTNLSSRMSGKSDYFHFRLPSAQTQLQILQHKFEDSASEKVFLIAACRHFRKQIHNSHTGSLLFDFTMICTDMSRFCTCHGMVVSDPYLTTDIA